MILKNYTRYVWRIIIANKLLMMMMTLLFPLRTPNIVRKIKPAAWNE